MKALEERIRHEIVLSQAEAVSVALNYPARSIELLIDSDRSFHPASTIKICLMLEAYRAHEKGEFSLNANLPVVNSFASIVDGTSYSLSPEEDSDPTLYELVGSSAPAVELVERMIVRSSNLATNILVQLLTPEKISTFMRSLGATDLLIRRGVEDNKAYHLGLNNVATALGLNTVLLRLLSGTAVSPEADQEMIEILLRQEFNNGIPKMLPSTVKVAHKTGWNGPLFHDTGILYPPQAEPYVLTVMTQGLSGEDEGPELVAKISRIIYQSLFEELPKL